MREIIKFFPFYQLRFKILNPSDFRFIGGDFLRIKVLVTIGWFDTFGALFESFPKNLIEASNQRYKFQCSFAPIALKFLAKNYTPKDHD